MGKPKQVNYQLLERDSEEGAPVYEMLRDLVEAYHDHLSANRIAIMWRFGWKADPDGRIQLGQCKKASDIDRELRKNLDFVILLSWEFWSNGDVTDDQRRALLDHELMHAAEAVDEDGEPKVDSRRRKVFRLRKHDVEEFTAIVRRHGIWKQDLEAFAAVLQEKQRTPLFSTDTVSRAVQRTIEDAGTVNENPAAASTAALRMAAVVDETSLGSVEIRTPGGKTVRFDAEAGKRARKELARRGVRP